VRGERRGLQPVVGAGKLDRTSSRATWGDGVTCASALPWATLRSPCQQIRSLNEFLAPPRHDGNFFRLACEHACIVIQLGLSNAPRPAAHQLTFDPGGWEISARQITSVEPARSPALIDCAQVPLTSMPSGSTGKFRVVLTASTFYIGRRSIHSRLLLVVFLRFKRTTTVHLVRTLRTSSGSIDI
jgi:hypothetical protein